MLHPDPYKRNIEQTLQNEILYYKNEINNLHVELFDKENEISKLKEIIDKLNRKCDHDYAYCIGAEICTICKSVKQ